MQEILRWSASMLTIVPGIVIAARVRPLWTVWTFVARSMAGAFLWIAVASLVHDYALLAQSIAADVRAVCAAALGTRERPRERCVALGGGVPRRALGSAGQRSGNRGNVLKRMAGLPGDLEWGPPRREDADYSQTWTRG
jgi:hypothetical protein